MLELASLLEKETEVATHQAVSPPIFYSKDLKRSSGWRAFDRSFVSDAYY